MKNNHQNINLIFNRRNNNRNPFRKIGFSIARFIQPKPIALNKEEGWVPIRTPIAGVMHKNQYLSVMELSLLEMVTLIREPQNKFDSNAIRIMRQDGKRLGYVGRNIAQVLAPFLDETQRNLHALVTDITSDITGAVVGGSICFYLPKDIYLLIYSKAMKDVDFFIETTNERVVYLFINCDEGLLNYITNLLSTHDLQWIRSGLSYRPASNGSQYRWYIRFMEGIKPESVDQFLKKDLLIIPYQEKVENELDEFFRLFDSENVNLKNINLHLEKLNQKLMVDNDLLQNQISCLERSRSNKWNIEFQNIIRELLPNIELKRDSLDVISREVKDYQQILKILKILSTSPEKLKGYRVKTTKEWFERHFNSGDKDDGRIYYKKEGNNWMVVISEKNSQSRDIKWLKKN